ncbi:glycosyltransferase [Geobacter sp. SVR]|uniref:glycosyltransferase n=1 Tax=Geobacter sp. SVR TaxID=2495594 RepID=UPI00143EF878|nr:glycosyltransferase [Geobacter sp. SVR]BCS54871.1 glycosyl transferase [Geobacter sp. SVR]GCF87389.1 glycosyl transferase family 1 [Geobacter sp. SVR]
MQSMIPLHHARIIFVFGSLDLGGAERQGLLLAESLRNDYGAEVEVWGLKNSPGRLSELCEEKGLPWRGVKCGWGRYALTRLAKLGKFALTLRKRQPDAILAYTRLPNLVCGIAWHFTGARIMVWNQRDEGLLLKDGFWERLAVRNASCFISNSLAGKVFLEKLYRVPSRKISVIHNGILLSARAPEATAWRKKLQIPEGTPTACMIANIHHYKDHHTLLRAWALVTLKDSPPPVLLLAGRIDEGGDELLTLAEQLGISERVKLLGQVDDVGGLLRSVDVCVHSSVSEGLPNAVLEAMAAGIAVAGTDIPGIREAVGPDGYRFLAPVRDVERLASSLAELLQDKLLRERVGALMLERAKAEFDVGELCARTAALLAREMTADESL